MEDDNINLYQPQSIDVIGTSTATITKKRKFIAAHSRAGLHTVGSADQFAKIS
jgi:hypothetical protein